MVTNYDGEQINIPENLPMLPVRDIVVFPFMILPLFVGRDSSIKAVEEALARNDRLIFLASQKNISDENPSPEGIFGVGTVAMIMRMRKLPDGRVKILTQGLLRGKIDKYNQHAPFYEVKIDKIEDDQIEGNIETEAIMRTIREQLEKVISLGKMISPDILMVLDDIKEPGRLADLVASNIGLKIEESQKVLEIVNPKERLALINEYLIREVEILTMQAKIRSNAKEEMTKSQKEYFLREQIKAIKSELGDQDQEVDEIQELRDKIAAAKMPPDVETESLKQISRLERMHPDASEASILRTYIDWLIELPWSKSTQDNLDIKRAKQILDEDHYDLQKVKERILEYLAVRKLREHEKSMKGPILCFAGPPGVGKTSLGKSIARALGREFIRISLGGIKDEAEMRGHRRTYVGALPGRIIQGLKQAGTNNPVFMMDEIDKLGSDFKGDPSSALLEILDPEQNWSFRDHYINLAFDLSKVMFIGTANYLESIPSALRDRLEIIDLPGYTEEEKIKISQQYLIPKQMKENGITQEHISFNDDGLRTIISGYTREAGLRNLERSIGTLCRKTAKHVAEGNKNSLAMVQEQIEKMMGPPTFSRESELQKDEVGIATGLAWTAFGGEILHIETSLIKGKGGFTLTGQLGSVMKESAQAAFGYLRSQIEKFGIDETILENHELHIHIPAGAIPKDGPSAGITLATAILSRLSGIPVRRDVAMTGEITLTGKVLPIGGIKEKALAAMRAGIKEIIIPERNHKDLVDIPDEYREKLKFVKVSSFDEVIETALAGKLKGATKKKRRKPVLVDNSVLKKAA